MTIRVRDLMPTFTASVGADGHMFRYEDIWQRRNMVLVSLPANDPDAGAYAASLSALERDVSNYDAVLVVTATPIETVPSPGVVVADRWGEVYFVQAADRASSLPAADELAEWLRYVRNECPECQGEAR